MEQIPEPKLNDTTHEVSVDPSLTVEASNNADKTLIVNDSGALPIVALIISILGLVCCSRFGFTYHWISFRQNFLRQIRQGTLSNRHESIAKIAYIVGIIGTSLSVIFWICYIGYLVFMIFGFGVLNQPV